MKEILKTLFEQNGNVTKSNIYNDELKKDISLTVITIKLKIDNNIKLMSELDKYLHKHNIDSVVIKDLKDDVYMYLKIYGKNDCNKFLELINS